MLPRVCPVVAAAVSVGGAGGCSGTLREGALGSG